MSSLTIEEKVSLLIASFAGDKTDIREGLQILYLSLGQLLVQCRNERDPVMLWGQFREYMDREIGTIVARIGERDNARANSDSQKLQ
jgi:hypothetical protein